MNKALLRERIEVDGNPNYLSSGRGKIFEKIFQGCPRKF